MDVDITIIGAGVVGLAIASRLSEKYNNIFVLERNNKFGQEASSRNSEVIHSGIYYPRNSLKAQLCVKGNKLLYSLCEKENIPIRKCGKLIVATNEKEIEELNILYENAKNNGVNNLQFLDSEEIAKKEPHIFGIKALFSPSTGIIDTHSLMKYFETNSKDKQVDFAYQSNVISIDKINNGYRVFIKDSLKKDFSFTCSTIINCAGLESDKISKMVGIDNESYKIHFCKGEYFSIRPPKNRLVSRLVYPVPNENLDGLGIHATIDMGGGLKLGPNVVYLDKNEYDYKVDDSHQEEFFNSAKSYLPFLEKEDLQVEMAGIRSKIQTQGDTTKDFIINNEKDNGFPNFINLIGIESPGLTASMAIAEYVEELILEY